MVPCIVAGFDEAGLGPVFGPLIVAGAAVKTSNLEKLKSIGVKDSKQFGGGIAARLKRKQVLKKAESLIEYYQFRAIEAKELDINLRKGVKMYDLEINALAMITRRIINEQPETSRLYYHQIGQLSKERFFAKLVQYSHLQLDESRKVSYEKKADVKYVPVSMASIIAKVTRDSMVESICNSMGREYVSGYGTSKTEVFLYTYFREHGFLPEHVRATRKWAPIRSLLSWQTER